MPGEHLQVEVASVGLVQTNPVGNVAASPTDVTIPGIVQTNSLDSGNARDSVADVNEDDSPDSEMEQTAILLMKRLNYPIVYLRLLGTLA